ncbi:MAG: T9SS type A sorting domain-containing protein [Chlorobi bacterium]|nr:T9SS type A sorting domain-containing protein [Chlorobiota bacterium]
MKIITIFKKSVLGLSVLFATINMSAQNLQWAKDATSTGNITGSCLTVDDSDNIYVMGSYNYPDTVYFDSIMLSLPQYSTKWLAKYDAAGQIKWVNKSVECTQFKRDNAGYFYTISQTNANTGNNNIIVEKLDNTGAELWYKISSGAMGANRGNCIDIDNSGHYFIGGITGTDVTFDTITVSNYDGEEGFIAKFDTSGAVQWALNFWGYNDGVVNEISVDPMGNTAVVGTFEDTINIGDSVFVGAGAKDIFVAKIDANGNVLWAIHEGGTNDDKGDYVGTDNSGNVYIGGSFASSTIFNSTNYSGFNMYVAKYAATDGTLQWVNTAPGSYVDRPRDIAVSSVGTVILGGFAANNIIFGTDTVKPIGSEDYFLAKLDVSGNWIWAESYDGANCIADLSEMVLDNSGNIIFTGSVGFSDNSQGILDFNGIPLNINTRDMLLAKVNNADSTGVGIITNSNYLRQVNVYPNPTRGLLNINFDMQYNDVTINIYDLTGKIVMKRKTGNQRNLIDVSQLHSGMYLYRIETKQGMQNGKLNITK